MSRPTAECRFHGQAHRRATIPRGKMKQSSTPGEERRSKSTKQHDGRQHAATRHHQASGMARTFQNIRLFKTQTVFDNVLIAKHMRRTSNLFTATFRLNAQGGARSSAQEVLELLKMVGSGGREGRAGHLPALRQAAPAGDRPRAGHEPDAAAARRAGRRHEPAGDATS